MSGTFTPAGARAPALRILGQYTRLELRLALRRVHALGLTVAIPALAIAGVGLTDVVNLSTEDRLGFVVPGAIALSVMSHAFLSLAIGTGYERAYGALKRLGASALTRFGLVTGKAAAVLVIVVGQALLLAAFGALLGWRPRAGALLPALGLTALAVAAFAGLGLLLAARLRPETVTGAVTLVYVALLVFSGVVFPLPELGRVELLNPLAAYAEALRQALSYGHAAEPWAWYGLGLWAVGGIYAAALWFRWE